MTREEARRLLSGYATGSLTELEQQLLFDAALEDQELFDELAEEQAVKELVDLPGARRRLLEALGPEKRPLVWWPWAVGAMAAMMGVAVWLSRPVAEPEQVARVETPVAQPTTPAAPPVADQIETVQPAPEPPKTEAAKQEVAKEVAAAAAPEPALALADQAKAELRAEATPQQEARAKAAPLVAPTKPPFPVANGFLGRVAAPPPPAAPGTLTYEVRNTGILRMTPSQTGVLEVTFDGRPLYPPRAVAAGVTIDVSIPLEAQQLRIDFAGDANSPVAAAQTGQVQGTLAIPGTTGRAVVIIPAQR